MFQKHSLGILIHFFILSFALCDAENIDTSHAVLIKNNADGPRAHFGTTVLLVNDKEASVIVGAPKSNSTLPGHDKIFEPGVVWQCFLERTKNPCRVVVMDPTANDLDLFRDNVMDRKDEGWLGGALAENEDSFLACGSRWANRFFETAKDRLQIYLNGICHYRPKNDLEMDSLPPLLNDSRILPIAEKKHQHHNIWEYGQAGFSIHSHPGSKEFVLGAPGVVSWRGSVIKISGEDKYHTATVYDNINSNSNLVLQNDSYFGFSVNSGNFLDKPGIQYVSGAPRGNDLKGQVVVFSFPLMSEEDVYLTLEGTQMGSYFGSSLCVADINGDKWDDLVIGAPLYSTEFKLTPRLKENMKMAQRQKGSGDEGAIFVYLSNNGTGLQQQNTSFNGPEPWSQFGTAIVNLGDINNDGYADIAVGAPYADLGTGIVYVFTGSKKGLVKTASQTILGKTFSLLIAGFGYSIFSKDIDLNGYNDLAIGAYNSNHVMILRTMPLINVTGEIRSNLTQIPFDTTSFELESCLLFNGEHAPKKQTLDITITADVQSRMKRVHISPVNVNDFAVQYNYQLQLSFGVLHCRKLMAKIVQSLGTSGSPVEISLTISTPDDSIPIQPTVFEISRFGSNVNTQTSAPGYQSFCKTCPFLLSSQKKLKSLRLPLAVNCGDDLICNSNLKISVGFAELDSDEASFTIGYFSTLTMEVLVFNEGETAISPAVTVSWSVAELTLKKKPSDCKLNGTLSINCELGSPLDHKITKTVTLEFEMKDVFGGSLKQLSFEAKAMTTSEEIDPNSAIKTIVLNLITKADIYMNGWESKMKFNLETLSPSVYPQHSYDIGLDGPSSIAEADVIFSIPVGFEHSSIKSMIQIDVAEPKTSMQTSQSSIECYAEPESFEFKKFNAPIHRTLETVEIEQKPNLIPEEVSKTPDHETETDAEVPEDVVQDAGIIWRKSGVQLHIECGSTIVNVSCMNVRCRISKMIPDTKASVTFPMRIASSALRNMFKKSQYSSIKIVSNGKSQILQFIQTDMLPNKSDSADAVTIIEEEVAKPVSLWIYFLGIVLGLVILSAILYCLYKIGVFVRKRPTDEVDKEDSVPLRAIIIKKADGANKKTKDKHEKAMALLPDPSLFN